ncbi:unnamed protein product, partial [Laminaria digitata]
STVAPRGLGEQSLEGVEGGRGGCKSNGVAGTGPGDTAADVGHEGGPAAAAAVKNATGAAGNPATGAAGNPATGADGNPATGADDVKATAAVIGEEAEGGGERVPSMDGLLI